ncbi:PilN domain-containing protein [Pelagicoccus sp. SDUM812002]|uniref:PilN domain-containing protein n=1 Tax=Pelagicoccus sp. SDUM812002 TaxID=3041266 RepID=UPI002811F279|nr:PilN domain-containing protein [Pelagicoccus sp. SDUM812002]
MNIEEDIQKLESEIATYEARHDEKVKYNADFMKVSRSLNEIVEFEGGRLVASDLLLSLSSRLPDGMYLDRVEYSDGIANIQGSVLVSAEEASRLVNDYLRSIEGADVMQGLLDEYKLTSLERGSVGDGFAFRIEITKKEEKK